MVSWLAWSCYCHNSLWQKMFCNFEIWPSRWVREEPGLNFRIISHKSCLLDIWYQHGSVKVTSSHVTIANLLIVEEETKLLFNFFLWPLTNILEVYIIYEHPLPVLCSLPASSLSIISPKYGMSVTLKVYTNIMTNDNMQAWCTLWDLRTSSHQRETADVVRALNYGYWTIGKVSFLSWGAIKMRN